MTFKQVSGALLHLPWVGQTAPFNSIKTRCTKCVYLYILVDMYLLIQICIIIIINKNV